MTLSIFMSKNVFGVCLECFSLDSFLGLQVYPKKFFSSAIYSPLVALSSPIRYGTKIKNCSGFMKVDQILKVWSFLSPKILISSKQVELKMCMDGPNPRGTSRTQQPSTKFFFQSCKSLKVWSFLESLHLNLSEK